MVRAAGIIRDKPSAKLAAVASSVGYASESSFGKVFRRVMGVSPGEYRRRHQQRTDAGAHHDDEIENAAPMDPPSGSHEMQAAISPSP